MLIRSRSISAAWITRIVCCGTVWNCRRGRLRTRPPTAAEYKNLANGCEELAKYGADKGITLAYHPHVGCTIETEVEIDIFLNQTKQSQLCLDVSHIGLVGENPIAHLRKYKARIGYVHLKDWADGKFVEIGRGTIGLDFGLILAELKSQRFPGWVVVEQSAALFHLWQVPASMRVTLKA